MAALSIKTSLTVEAPGFVYRARLEYGPGEVLEYGPVTVTADDARALGLDSYGVLEMCQREMIEQTRPKAYREDKGGN